MGFFTHAIEDIAQEPWLIPSHPRREDFLYFRGSSKKSISTYRCVIASYWTFWVLLSILGSVGVPIPAPLFGVMDKDMDIKWLIFLTNWSMLLLGTYLWTAYAASRSLPPSLPPTPPSSPSHHRRRLYQAVWVLRNCTAIAALVVSLLFWCVLFPEIKKTSWVDVHCHAINSVIVLIDLTVTHVPYYFKHGWMGLSYLVVYLLFSIVYWLSGGTDPEGDHFIYPPLNYKHPSEAAGLVVVVVVIVVPLVHILLYVYNRLLFQKGFWQGQAQAQAPRREGEGGTGRMVSDRVPLLPN